MEIEDAAPRQLCKQQTPKVDVVVDCSPKLLVKHIDAPIHIGGGRARLNLLNPHTCWGVGVITKCRRSLGDTDELVFEIIVIPSCNPPRH